MIIRVSEYSAYELYLILHFLAFVVLLVIRMIIWYTWYYVYICIIYYEFNCNEYNKCIVFLKYCTSKYFTISF